ncbi:uncharacterized protein LOC21398581 [Morus notabilis]|uniref:uncharacterized protein LOC21398581 n=1 Tax=Morus notabilis TaxID=981085 RepID=UPI000CECF2C5|nr:uncharacterized protein LOC21398581 [Morus notabilis]
MADQNRTQTPTAKEEEESIGPATPSPHPRAASRSPSPLAPSVARLWRPAAQRNLKNQWSKLASLTQQWKSSSSASRSHATSLVNAYLSLTYIPSMELGVLSDMPDIRKKGSWKLLKQQEGHRTKLLSSYKDMVGVVAQMVKISKSMRLYLKVGSASSLVQFSDFSEDKNDPGDGGGIPIFTFWSISYFEKLAEELVQMLISELNLKRLLVVELLSTSCESSMLNKFNWTDELYTGEFDDLSICNLYSGETSEPVFPRLQVSKSNVPAARSNQQPNREIMQVYLTTWLAEVNIDTHSVDEIFSLVGEEMHVNLS